MDRDTKYMKHLGDTEYSRSTNFYKFKMKNNTDKGVLAQEHRGKSP